MLETIAIILIILWLLGMVSGYTLGNFIWVLLVIAVAAIGIAVANTRTESPNARVTMKVTLAKRRAASDFRVKATAGRLNSSTDWRACRRSSSGRRASCTSR